MMESRVLVTGATGFIGSHTCVALASGGHFVHGIDNFSNSSPSALEVIRNMCGALFQFDECDVRDSDRLTELVRTTRPTSVIHFAALKSVPESKRRPLVYYDNNVGGALALLKVMEAEEIRRIVFSSSAMVYGANLPPYSEESPTSPINVYGSTKLVVENILRDLSIGDRRWAVTNLRYFNPVGAHPTGLLGEDVDGGSSNLMPELIRVAIGRAREIQIFGDDYPTPDGTALRDYIHVMDLADAHVSALQRANTSGVSTINLGTGRPVSVLELIAAFRRASNVEIPARIAQRREGDVASLFARVEKAKQILGWTATRSIDAMCEDAWRYARRRYLGSS